MVSSGKLRLCPALEMQPRPQHENARSLLGEREERNITSREDPELLRTLLRAGILRSEASGSVSDVKIRCCRLRLANLCISPKPMLMLHANASSMSNTRSLSLETWSTRLVIQSRNAKERRRRLLSMLHGWYLPLLCICTVWSYMQVPFLFVDRVSCGVCMNSRMGLFQSVLSIIRDFVRLEHAWEVELCVFVYKEGHAG